ncbi:MAG TPA: hypothetical protein VK742_04105 [Candidatus Sulfotelmatobacter sp.]|jgi:hypothetical protein|nr:hypothetical protein [Candidatus Sulfotelmatobacter sp.]
MIKFIKEELENEDSPVNDTFVRICVGGIILVVGGYFYYQYLFRLTHHVPKGGKITATAPAAPSQPDPVLVVPAPAPASAPAAVPMSDPTPAPVKNVNNTSFVAAPESSAPDESSQAKVMSMDIKAPVTEQRRSIGATEINMPKMTVKVDRPLTEAEKIDQAAQTGFSRVMNYAQHYPDSYGFAPDDSLEQAKLGDAIPVYTIAATDRHSYQAGQPVKPLLQPTGDLIFPVTYNGEVRYMVQVRKTSKGYAAGDGSKALALVYEKIVTTWPASGGYHPQLVVQKGVPDYYFTVPELPDPNLTDTSCMFQESPVLSPASVILASWR